MGLRVEEGGLEGAARYVRIVLQQHIDRIAGSETTMDCAHGKPCALDDRAPTLDAFDHLDEGVSIRRIAFRALDRVAR